VTAGAFTLRAGLPVVLQANASDADLETAASLARRIKARCGLELPVETHRDISGGGPALYLRSDASELPEEAYQIRVSPKQVVLRAAGGAGLRWASETLGQWLRPSGRLAACEIDDAPDFPRRGLLLDISRGKVPTRADLCQLVDRCCALKLNVLMLYVEHAFAFRRHPEIGAGCSPLSAADIRELDRYAAARHVELVPNLQTLGHMERVLVQARYAPLAEGPARWTLAPANPASYGLLGDLFDEFLPNFRSPLTHINCDEPWDLGSGQSKALADSLGGAPQLLVHHVETLRRLLRDRHGREQVMVWADFVHSHPERISDFDPSVVFCDWWYEGEWDVERVARFAKHGRRFWVCGGTCSWNALFPRVAPALETLSKWADAGRRHGAEGMLVTEWGDFGHYNLLGNNWLTFAWTAQEAWSGPIPDADFDRAFGALFFDDATRHAARVYRELGACHEVGFALKNASPVAFLFFDDLSDAWFCRAAKRVPLEGSRRRVKRVLERLRRERRRFAADPLSYDELCYAAEATLVALDKASAALPYTERRAGGAHDRRTRRSLARRFRALAERQHQLARRLRRLWLKRAAPSNFEVNAKRLRRSVASLRRAATELSGKRAAPALPDHPGFAPPTVLRLLREATGWPPGPRS
jgi:hypothetical protein